MKCLVVDDEALARQRLSSLLEELDDWEVCAVAAGGAEALKLVGELHPDLVLLDIRMPGMDGLEAARHMAMLDTPPAVIFTTAYGDHALEAFEAQAVDYLLKPIHPERLLQALDKARRLSPVQLEGLQQPDVEGAARTHLCARSYGSLDLMPVDEVLCLQADSKYVTARSASRQMLIEESLKALEQEFPRRFMRIHRNALVAVQAVRSLEKDAQGHSYVTLNGIEEHLEVSRRLLPDVRRRIKPV